MVVFVVAENPIDLPVRFKSRVFIGCMSMYDALTSAQSSNKQNFLIAIGHNSKKLFASAVYGHRNESVGCIKLPERFDFQGWHTQFSGVVKTLRFGDEDFSCGEKEPSITDEWAFQVMDECTGTNITPLYMTSGYYYMSPQLKLDCCTLL